MERGALKSNEDDPADGSPGSAFLASGYTRCNQVGAVDEETSSDCVLPAAQQKARLDTFL